MVTKKNNSMTEIVENYLKVIFVLNIEMGRPFAKTFDIATLLGVSLPSVTEMLQKLSKRGYIDYVPRKGAILRQKYIDVAMRLLRRNRLIKRFLIDILKISRDNAYRIACQMEHIMTDEMEQKLDEFLGYPKTCPLGSPIPRSLTDLSKLQGYKNTLDEINIPGKYIALRILDINKQTLGLLTKIGVLPGVIIEVLEIFPDSSFHVRINGQEHVLSRSVLKSIIVRRKTELNESSNT